MSKMQPERGGVRTEWLFDFLAGCDEAEVDERGEADAEDSVVAEEVDQLEWEEEQVDPHSAVGNAVSE